MFRSLDFVYLPSRDVEAELKRYAEDLGAEVVFAIEAFDTRVGMLKLTAESPRLLLAEHLEGDQPVLVFRVDNLEEAVGELEAKGVPIAARFGIPHGPGVELVTPGPQRVALYELTRPGADERLGGRRDF